MTTTIPATLKSWLGFTVFESMLKTVGYEIPKLISRAGWWRKRRRDGADAFEGEWMEKKSS